MPITTESVTGSTCTLTVPEQPKETAEQLEWRLRTWFIEDALRYRFEGVKDHVMLMIDASVPNKEQNRALKKMIGDKFDSTWLDILNVVYPKIYGSAPELPESLG